MPRPPTLGRAATRDEARDAQDELHDALEMEERLNAFARRQLDGRSLNGPLHAAIGAALDSAALNVAELAIRYDSAFRAYQHAAADEMRSDEGPHPFVEQPTRGKPGRKRGPRGAT